MKKDWKFVSVREEFKAGKASKYIKHCGTEIRRGDKVILCCRASGRMQNHTGNLADQEANLREQMERLGAIVVGVITHVGSGWEPYWLMRAAALAERHGAKLVAETTDRFIRNDLYHSRDRPNAQATEIELKRLRNETLGVLLSTPKGCWCASVIRQHCFTPWSF
jgi:hypothetical protein